MTEEHAILNKDESPEIIAKLAERVHRLECNNQLMPLRLMVFAGSILGALLFLTLTLGASPNHIALDVSEKVQTKSLAIIDDSGRTRATLDTSSDGGPCLALYDANGIVRGRFLIYQDINNAEIPRLVLSDEKGRTREMLGVSSDGSAVKLFDLDGNIRAILGLSTDNNGGLILMDKDGRSRAAFASKPDGTPSLDLFSPSGDSLFHAP